jgi:hypothetical protein
MIATPYMCMVAGAIKGICSRLYLFYISIKTNFFLEILTIRRCKLPLQLFTPPAEPEPVKPDETIEIKGHARKKRGRKPLPEKLPRIDILHDIPDEEKQCACGAQLSRIGEDTCEKLDYIPAKVQVLRHIRYKYACKQL